MTDMLVKLYELEKGWSFVAQQAERGITIRKPIAAERSIVVDWTGRHFSEPWANETSVALSRHPFTCFIALEGDTLVGLGCYNAIGPGFFGPLGVLESHRGQGTGRALLLACLLDMRLAGYGYAIIGWVGPAEFYRKTVNAVEIPNSRPGYWLGWLHRD